MNTYVGIRSSAETYFESIDRSPTQYAAFFRSLKQQSLLLDKIGILDLRSLEPTLGEHARTHIEWLQDQQIIYPIQAPAPEVLDIPGRLQESRDPRFGQDFWDLAERLAQESIQKIADARQWLEVIKATPEFADHASRLQAVDSLRKMVGKRAVRSDSLQARVFAVWETIVNGIDAVSLLPAYDLPQATGLTKDTVAQVVLRRLPLPDDETPWEQVLDFRNDPDNRGALLALRRWMRKLSAENLNPLEIQQELDWLTSEFTKHMKLHSMKANLETIETLIKLPADLLANLVKLDFSKLSEPLFVVHKRKLALMEAEITAPGREINFILKARSTFYDR